MRARAAGKKNIIPLLLALMLLCSCGRSLSLPPVPTESEPQQELAANEAEAPEATEEPEIEPTPEPFVEPVPEYAPVLPQITGYEGEVCPGSIRYVSQLKELRKNGWGKYDYKAGSECTTACISMALSCLGIDESPEKLLDYNQTTIFASSYGIENLVPSEYTGAVETAEKGYVTFTLLMENYLENRDWTVSPVLLYLAGNNNRHGILIVGAEEDCYLALDPASRGLHRIYITETGEISSAEGPEYLTRYTNNGKVTAKISALAQWSIEEDTGETVEETADDIK